MKRITVIFLSTGGTLGIGLLVFLFIAFGAYGDRKSQEIKVKELRKEKIVSLSDLSVYSGTGVDIDRRAECKWLETNAPYVSYGITGLNSCYVSENRETYDGAFPDAKYNKSFYGDYSTHNQNEASEVSRYLNKEFSTFNAVLFLEKNDVNQWKDSEYCDMQGVCFIFGDDRLLYQSPVLTPENPHTQFVEIDVSSVKELVIIIVGSAHMCNAYVTR